MRKLSLLVLLSAAAFGGTRFVENTGGLPTAATDGVSMAGVTACRGSVRFSDGGTVAGGKLIPMYYDTAIAQWVEAKTVDQCSLATDTLVDGGARRAQLCEFKVVNPFGRVALISTGLTPQAVGKVRLECWGIDLPVSDGGAR